MDSARRVFGAGFLGGIGARSSAGARILAAHDAAFGAGGVRTRGYPRYWVKAGREVLLSAGKPGLITCWGWSATSPDEARSMAEARLQAAVAPFGGAVKPRGLMWPPEPWELATKGKAIESPFDVPQTAVRKYSLGERKERKEWLWGYNPKVSVKMKTGMPSVMVRPEVEPIIGEVAGLRGPVGVVTRNRYGAKILNATNAMFVDIDGANKTDLRAALADWSRGHPEAAMRVYETQNGLRVLRTDRTFDATNVGTRELMAGMGADKRYVEMCAAQDCFRARLTPKPWRCGVADAPSAFGASEVAQASWLQAYDRVSQAYGVCRYLGSMGPKVVAPEVAPVVVLHDREAIRGAVLA